MSNDMEIIKEFKKVIECKDPTDEHEIYGVIGKVAMWLPDAVKRDRVKLLKDLNMRIHCLGVSIPDRIQQMIDENSPKPRYCEGMQTMIDGSKPMNETGIYKYDKERYFAHISTGVRLIGDVQLRRCPFCPDGKNCIAEK